jgi:hypothetical protein
LRAWILLATSEATTWTFRARQGYMIQEGRHATALSLGLVKRFNVFLKSIVVIDFLKLCLPICFIKNKIIINHFITKENLIIIYTFVYLN